MRQTLREAIRDEYARVRAEYGIRLDAFLRSEYRRAARDRWLVDAIAAAWSGQWIEPRVWRSIYRDSPARYHELASRWIAARHGIGEDATMTWIPRRPEPAI